MMRLFPLFTVSQTLQLLLVIFSQGTQGWGNVLGAVYYVGGVPRTVPELSPLSRREQLPLPWEPNSPGPMFDPSPPQNVTALKDDIAYLHCIVHNRGNRTVSWIRVSDLHILTVAQYTYTADDRFEVIHSPDSNAQSWVLKINSVQPRDSGRYECQINTHPTDPITFPVDLSVFVPSAKILGSPERYVDRSSTINLTCIINFNPESPTEIFWYHNNKVINYDDSNSRVSVITDRGAVTKTTLLIHDAHDAATGTYSCVPSASTTASVRIHILKGEIPAAMQTNAANAVVRPLRWQHFFGDHSLLLLLLLLLLVFGRSSANHKIVTKGNDQVSASPRDDPEVVRNCGKLLVEMTRCVPDGIVCFFTSYLFLENVVTTWYSHSIISDLQWHMLVFIETHGDAERSLALINNMQTRGNSFLTFGAMRKAVKCVGRVMGAKADYGIVLFAHQKISRSDKQSRLLCWIHKYLADRKCNLSLTEPVQITQPWQWQMVQPSTRDDQLGVPLLNGNPTVAEHRREHSTDAATGTADTISSPGSGGSMVTLAAFDTVTPQREEWLCAYTGHF